jgi:type IV pilus assembly protein PilV
MSFNHKSDAAMHGFTLIEVLMAALVLALALTGMVRLHLTALRAQRQSVYQAGALQLATDMAEIIRAWRAPADDRPFLFDYRRGDAIPAANDCYGGALCDPPALRAFGVAHWLEAVRATLPAARVSICRDAAPWNAGGGYAWSCSGHGGIMIKLGWRMASDHGDRSEPSSQDGPQLVLGVGADDAAS